MREKELAINARLERAAEDARQKVADAERDCSGIMSAADEEGRAAALAYYDAEKSKIDAAVDAIRLAASREARAADEAAARNMDAAVGLIVRSVTMR